MSVHRFIITIINSTQVRHQYTVYTYCIDPDLGQPWHPSATDVISVPDPLESCWIALLSKSSRSTSAMVELCTVSHSVMPFFWSPHHTQPLLLFKRQVASSTSSGERIIRVFFECEWEVTKSWQGVDLSSQKISSSLDSVCESTFSLSARAQKAIASGPLSALMWRWWVP